MNREPVPEPFEAELTRLLDGPEDEFWPGVARLCQLHPDRAEHIWRLAGAVRAAGSDAQRENGGDPAGAPGAAVDLRPGDRIGSFTILDRIGQGGMGSVYVAEQREPIRRRVALKVIKLGMDTKAVLARFEAERQALALMDHPHIAKVYEAGATPTGRPYFAMEHVQGVPITHYCDEHRLSVEERLELFRQVCAGVQHAHHKGVIHRDLTPNNILVALVDGKPSAKIIDFGLARATGHRLTDRTVFTEQGVILGTPEYMAPEQAGLTALDVDVRSDVYTLGVVLYELLTGALPFDGQELRRVSYAEMAAILRTRDPDKPSTRSAAPAARSEVARHRRAEAGQLLRRLRGDLDWIVLRCLEKDRARRYQSAGELSADVLCHLQQRPISARPPSTLDRLRRFVHRHRVGTIATVAGVTVLAAASASIVWVRANARHEVHLRQDVLILPALIERAGLVWRRAHLRPQDVEDWLEQADDLLARHPPGASAEPAATGTTTGLRTRDDEVEALATQREQVAKMLAGASYQDDVPVFAGLFALDQRLAEAAAASTGRSDGGLGPWQPPRATGAMVSMLREWRRRLVVRTDAVARLRGEWTGPASLAHWHAVLEELGDVRRSPMYRGLRMTRQEGLVPLGRDPHSGLFEFCHPLTGDVPRRDPGTGHLQQTIDTGLVLVLLPGGSCVIGAQGPGADASDDPSDREHAGRWDGPVVRVELAPFFLSKFEMTQAQWERCAARNPSLLQAGRGVPDALFHGMHPVESVTWYEAEQVLADIGLMLPTEAQWEHGARGGTTTAWWTGPGRESLEGAENLCGRPGVSQVCRGCFPWTDAWTLHAPVGSFRPNPMGLYDVAGNVSEWCQDAVVRHGPRTSGLSAGSGLLMERGVLRALRGGSFRSGDNEARSARRGFDFPHRALPRVGVRPARPVLG